MVEDHSVVDKVHSFSVMVYYDHSSCSFIKGTAFDIVFIMGINYNKKIIFMA